MKGHGVATKKTIDLGEYGSLVAPAYVGDKTYMVLSTTKRETHTWHDFIPMRKLQDIFFNGQVVFEDNRLCEVNGHRLQLSRKDDLLGIYRWFGGPPSGWVSGHYWSATPSANGHARIHLATGYVSAASDSGRRYVAFEVLL